MHQLNHFLIFFLGEHIPNLLAIKLRNVIRSTRQRQQDVLQYLPTISKIIPNAWTWILPLINDHLFGGHPPPPYNDKLC